MATGHLASCVGMTDRILKTKGLPSKAAHDFASMNGDESSGLSGYRSVLLRFIDLIGAFAFAPLSFRTRVGILGDRERRQAPIGSAMKRRNARFSQCLRYDDDMGT